MVMGNVCITFSTTYLVACVAVLHACYVFQACLWARDRCHPCKRCIAAFRVMPCGQVSSDLWNIRTYLSKEGSCSVKLGDFFLIVLYLKQ